MADLPVLDATEQRILGSLLEKQVTVPSSYPLSGNALTTACNQTSSRDPVVDYDQSMVESVARELKQRGLLRIVWTDTGRRTLKYHQTLDEHLDLDPAERAVLTVLLLRGPQAPGELKTRTERLHPFADRGEVEGCLARMATRTPPLVVERARRPGQQDARWAHLLGPVPDGPPAPTAATADLDSVLAGGAAARDQRVRAAYDAVAAAYADALCDELDDLPLERWLLDRVAEHAGDGPVVEAGCGPGHVTAYVAERGADASGLDLSPAMVEEARRRYPDGVYAVGDLRRLLGPPTSPGWSAVLGWYSLIHLAGSELAGALAALARPIVSGGWLVVALHAGSEVRRLDTWFGQEVALDVVLHEPASVVAAMEAAGLVEVEWYVRGPVRARGETTQRLYAIGRRA